MPSRANKARPNCYPPNESGIDIQSDGGHVKYGPRFDTGAGKGSKRRPGNSEAYRRGWERIFGKDEVETINVNDLEGIGVPPGEITAGRITDNIDV